MTVKVNVRRKHKRSDTLLVIDADIIAYQSVTQFLQETAHEGKYGREYTYTVVERDFQTEVTRRIDELQNELLAGDVLLCFGSISNWRKNVLKTYKANRSNKKPLGYAACVDWMSEMWDSISRPFLEADDLVGLIHTGAFPDLSNGKTTIAVSEDKDFQSIPGKLYNPRKPDRGVIEISPQVACFHHLVQTLTGDVSDNYKGCPGVGPKKAYKILAENREKNLWKSILAAYEKAGLDEEDALVQARVARILQGNDYSPDSGELELWEPSLIAPCTWIGTDIEPWNE